MGHTSILNSAPQFRWKVFFFNIAFKYSIKKMSNYTMRDLRVPVEIPLTEEAPSPRIAVNDLPDGLNALD